MLSVAAMQWILILPTLTQRSYKDLLQVLASQNTKQRNWDFLPRWSRTVDLAFQRVQEPLVQSLSALSILHVGDLLAAKERIGSLKQWWQRNDDGESDAEDNAS